LDYKLVFDKHSIKWRADAANIKPEAGSIVWGFVYQLDEYDMASVTKREGGYDLLSDLTAFLVVGDEIFEKISVVTFSAPNACLNNCGPSREYLDAVLRGATEKQLPGRYIDSLRTSLKI
jgi:hypothetical protein